MSDDRLLRQIRQLDPATTAAPDATAQIRRNAMLERVLATPRTAPDPIAVPRPRRFIGRIALVGAAALVAGGVLLAHGLTGTDSGGFTSAQLASWVATPAARSTDQLSAATKSWCADSTAKQSSAPAAFSNGDQRGRIASMVVTRGGYRDLCLATGDGHGYWEILDGPDLPLPALAERQVNLQSAGSHGDPATSVNTIWGQVGSDVTGLRFHTGGQDITATVGGGIWSAWWPGSVDLDVPSTVTVTFTNGASATIPLPQA